jgi:signal transduction histidine kinase
MSDKKNLKPRAADLERERLNSLVNSLVDGVITVDEKLKVVLSNGAALNVLDINGPITGRYITRVMRLIDNNNQPVSLNKIITNTQTSTVSRDWRLKYSDGSIVNIYISIAPVHLGFGHGPKGMHGYIILIRDITREKSLEEERDEFISVVSHELRTPITIAEGNIGNAEFILNKTGDTDMIREALDQAHQQIGFLACMINNLATLSRAEREKLTVDIENINAYELIEDLADEYTPEAEKKRLVLQTDIDPTLELLKSSHLYVHEILQNFITNALKYTNKGHITIGAIAKPKGVLFYVSDTGIGISRGDRERVFDKFFRSEDFRTRQTNGTGLGLYVTMKLARLLHADIDVKSVLSKGSTFSIYIPNLE